MVVQAYILIQTDVGKAAAVAARITDIKGVILAQHDFLIGWMAINSAAITNPGTVTDNPGQEPGNSANVQVTGSIPLNAEFQADWGLPATLVLPRDWARLLLNDPPPVAAVAVRNSCPPGPGSLPHARAALLRAPTQALPCRYRRIRGVDAR